MKFEAAPLSFGAASIEPGTLVIGAILVAVMLAVIFAGRREMATIAVFAGIIGAILVSN